MNLQFEIFLKSRVYCTKYKNLEVRFNMILMSRSVLKWNKATFLPRTTDTHWLNPLFFADQIQIPIPNKYLGVGYKGLVLCWNNGWLMENMDKGLTVSKWVLINRLKIPQMLQNLSVKIICPSPEVWNFYEKRLHWASIVRVLT